MGLTFGQYVRTMRNRSGKSLRKVAGEVGFSPMYLSEVETGKRPPAPRRWWGKMCESIPDLFMPALWEFAARDRLGPRPEA